MPQAIVMTYINITKFALINELEKDHSMIEMCCLKNVIFIQNNFKFCAVNKNYFSIVFYDEYYDEDNSSIQKKRKLFCHKFHNPF